MPTTSTTPSGRRDVLVVGPPRSGTSALAGLLADSGWVAGDGLLPPSPANPRGFFESSRVNTLNDDLLVPHLASSAVPVGRRHAWLAALPTPLAFDTTQAMRQRIVDAVPASPFVVKDPRMTMTLPVWRDALPDAVVVAIVRHPAAVVDSLLREIARDTEYYAGLEMDAEAAFTTWVHLADHLLAHAPALDLVLRHGDLLGEGREQVASRLAQVVGNDVTVDSVEPSLRRSSADRELPGHVAQRWDALCGLAGSRQP